MNEHTVKCAHYTLAVAAVFGALGVMAGAFGAHALEGRVSEARLDTYGTAVQYHLYHALALLLTGTLALRDPARRLKWVSYTFAAGILLFSGSLYALVLLDAPALAVITPFGGVLLIAGWVLLAWAMLSRARAVPPKEEN